MNFYPFSSKLSTIFKIAIKPVKLAKDLSLQKCSLGAGLTSSTFLITVSNISQAELTWSLIYLLVFICVLVWYTVCKCGTLCV